MKHYTAAELIGKTVKAYPSGTAFKIEESKYDDCVCLVNQSGSNYGFGAPVNTLIVSERLRDGAYKFAHEELIEKVHKGVQADAKPLGVAPLETLDDIHEALQHQAEALKGPQMPSVNDVEARVIALIRELGAAPFFTATHAIFARYARGEEDLPMM